MAQVLILARSCDPLSELHIADTVLSTRTGHENRKRRVIQPETHQDILLERLGLKLPAKMKTARLLGKNRNADPVKSRTYEINCGSRVDSSSLNIVGVAVLPIVLDPQSVVRPEFC